ncbi:MAG: hypothetical protein ABR521_11080, partial [Gaiellaceae bacterium]
MRTLTDIRQELERATERRGDLLRSLARGHDPALATEHAELEGVVARLWDEHRAARARLRFGDR